MASDFVEAAPSILQVLADYRVLQSLMFESWLLLLLHEVLPLERVVLKELLRNFLPLRVKELWHLARGGIDQASHMPLLG